MLMGHRVLILLVLICKRYKLLHFVFYETDFYNFHAQVAKRRKARSFLLPIGNCYTFVD